MSWTGGQSDRQKLKMRPGSDRVFTNHAKGVGKKPNNAKWAKQVDVKILPSDYTRTVVYSSTATFLVEEEVIDRHCHHLGCRHCCSIKVTNPSGGHVVHSPTIVLSVE